MNKQYAFCIPAPAQCVDELRAAGLWKGPVPKAATVDHLLALVGRVFPRTGAPKTLKAADGSPLSALAGGGAVISAGDFASAGLQLLGYQYGVDFDKDSWKKLANELKLLPPAKTMSGMAMLSGFYTWLMKKGKHHRSLLDIAVENGAFARYNQNRAAPIPLFLGGKSQPVFNPRTAITERVYVETALDTDQDGKRDRIAVYVRRPAATQKGLAVPAMYIANGYAAGYNDDDYILHPVDGDLAVKPPRPQDREALRWTPRPEKLPPETQPAGESQTGEDAPEYRELEASMGTLIHYLLPRGFAVVFSSGIGTRRSDGIRTCGSEEETESTVAVIRWLSGEARAFTTRHGDTEVKAWWCNGSVGMCGKSYLGTLSIAAAATGVRGLKAAVVESAISDWYRYYRENGLCSAALGWQGDDADLLAVGCLSRKLDPEDWVLAKEVAEGYLNGMKRDQDRESGDYNPFWDERNYLPNVKDTKAAIWINHGLNDWNVKPIQFAEYWKALRAAGVPSKMLLHQGEHVYPNNIASIDYYDMMNAWLSRHLWGHDSTAAQALPDVLVQDNADQDTWRDYAAWPVGKPVTYHLHKDGRLAAGKPKAATATFVDDVDASGYDRKENNLREWRDAFAGAAPGARGDQLVFHTEPLEKDMRVSGVIRLTVTAALDAPTGILSAMAVDCGRAARLEEATEPVAKNAVAFGYNWHREDLVRFKPEAKPGKYRIISRGHMNVQNKSGIYGADAITPGKSYTFTLELHPMEYTLKKGHRLGIILYGTDMELTPRPHARTTFTVALEGCRAQVPLAED